ncbi:glyoxalase [Paenibacillus lycopersici]|uniref:Glyoxalase n=1 Tax=Paenibacillus lycopersici TaxID=2704462 RepID=A0A6C0FV41_9BACL|nr:VOC family protein [Paenibacillus lycopersici]QHT58809.1 glyoxalase [Paenibacillus lycopersici]
MLHNRSVPANIILPHIYYEDVAAASAWLREAFGFAERFRFALPDGTPHGALLYLGEAWVMLKSPGQGATSPARLGGCTQQTMILVPDVDAHYRQALGAGARILEELRDTEYGERHYVAADPEGHAWIFAKHVRDVHPEAWGAVLAESP